MPTRTYDDKSAVLIKEAEVITAMWMEKQLRDRGMTEREIEEIRGVSPQGPVWWLGALGGPSGDLH